MDLRCKNLNLHGQTITVDGTTYTVPADGEDKGIVRDVAQANALKLLQNLQSWVPLDGPGVAKASPAPNSEPKPKSKAKDKKSKPTEAAPDKPTDAAALKTDDEPKKPGVMSRLFGGRTSEGEQGSGGEDADEGKEE